jgi:uncharacterized protein YraI
VRSQRLFSAGLGVTLLVISALACNLGVMPTTPTPRVSPTSSVRPTVAIQSPQNNADAVVGQPITVQASGSHPDGVTRLELRANMQQVDSKVSQNPLGDQQFAAYLNYTPTAPGVLILQVIAYRNDLASEAASIALNVKNQAAQVTATVAAPVGSTQVIPDDPTCRARVEVNGLNFRQGPSQSYPPLAVLGLGNVVYITGRTADNTWWQGRISNTVGWMSASFITLLGNCYGIQVAQPPASPVPTATLTPTTAPTVAQASVTPGKADLIVTDLLGPVSIVLDQNGTRTVSYTILVQNAGTANAANFNVGLVLPDGTQQDLGTVPLLVPGQKAQFQASVTFTAPGSARLNVVADTYNAIDESNETNNLKSLDVVLIKPTLVPTQAQ